MRKKVLIFLAIFVFILLVILVFENYSKQAPGNEKNISPATPVPTENLFLKTESILPIQNTTSPNLPIQFITFTFNLSVDPDHFYYKVDPFMEAVAKNGDSPNIIILSPKEKWQEGLTTITVLESTTSTTGVRLEKPVIYKIKTESPRGGV